MSPARSTLLRVGGFGVALAVLLTGGYAVGSAVGPVTGTGSDAGSDAGSAADAGSGADAGSDADAAHDSGGHDEPATTDASDLDLPGGLQVSDRGYTLVPVDVPATPGQEQPLSLQILGPDGHAVTEFETTHDKKLHLIVVRRDLSGFQHVHPTMAPDGTWTIPFTFPEAGTYRMFADFEATAADHGSTLGTDVDVAGAFTPVALPEPAQVAEVDGYEVTLDGELVPGTASRLTLSIAKDGRPVTDLQPYLAAYGHLVALRGGDLAYLHVHPDGEPGDGRTEPGPEIVFYAEVPTEGDYRLFLDFQHDGVVRTAEFTATAHAAHGEQGDSAPSHGHGEE